ncbi:Bacterial NAD-glutamate dehydrogenase superfamily [Nitrosococcus oceani AFC27]|uniref:NAD-glutamate dehydrogenase n=1 Tax=Nitrosococcus oceani C-27 TaxID=314279 RepID=A0A0E2ZIX0_9GAMM|nr:NAD-glutamate dehydrogenase domain-containing protein [Nitrosococcus oceani]EDZ66237.1 Bacterial NAD-glutamate dehydrogenase superfamily [Nitrosococcus oceani AFC27]KFI18162.1 NAD-glutamate dehydrogenase [Nitrosococcus oceani C-27]
MKIFVEVRESRATYSDHEKKINEIHSFLEQQSKIHGKRFLKALATILITPDSFLLSIPTYHLASLITDFFDLIEARGKKIAAHCFPFPEKTGTLLLISSPYASYLVESLGASKEAQDIDFHLMAYHALMIKRRDRKIIDLGTADKSGPKESLILLKLEDINEKKFQDFAATIQKIVSKTLQVQSDKENIAAQVRQLEQAPSLQAWKSFLIWCQQGAFIPFSYHCFIVNSQSGKKIVIQEQNDKRLGLPFDSLLESTKEENVSSLLTILNPEEIQRELPVLVQKTRIKSPLYHSEYLTYMGIREPLEKGQIKEHALIGLFSEKAFAGDTMNISALRDKAEQSLKQLRLLTVDHEYNKLIELLHFFPKVELFFMGEVQLQIIARSLLPFLYRSDTVKLLILASPSPTRISTLILIPQGFFDESHLRDMEIYLCQELAAILENSQLIRGIHSHYIGLHLTLIPQKEEVLIPLEQLENTLTRIAKPWNYKLQVLLEQAMGKEQGEVLWNKYGKGFLPEYQVLTPPQAALQDIKGLERVLETGQQFIDLWESPYELSKEHYRLQFYSSQESLLDELMPVLKNLGLRVIDQVRFTLEVENRGFFIKSFSIKAAKETAKPLSSLRVPLLDALGALFRGEVDDDPLNELLVLTGLSWKEIDIFRSYRNYYFQLGTHFTLSRFHQSLSHNPQVALLLCRYFEARFRPDPQWDDPVRREEEGLLPIRLELATALKSVTDVNEDRILRTLFNLIDATVRTNFYYRHKQRDYFLSFKISSLGVIDMPPPRPLYEIYIHSATVEGIHLRGGRVARGGLRWSDRPDDFRTEILGLMRTQMMKNSLIVPVGAKGGFIVKRSFSSREEGAKLAKQAYITFIQSLLDLTDNREGSQVVRPPKVVAYDEDDPYLVVAADKGTAHLPDTANEVAQEYHFWLDSAFASGGAFGYHHKKLGITARGAWECVKRHFRELDLDIQTQPFTAIGIGSMDGDVFGNGMLLSRQIRLLAAFGPGHIFIDPEPDPEVSYRERKRLFKLPGSSWNDYDDTLISEGGGIFPRRAKDIPLSPQVRYLLKTRHLSMDGEGLIRLLLTTPVDLLWFGGIGTYVKASTEKHIEVGDRTNDTVRVDASQLQARVVGEGANLGFTQRGRIEYALGGGRINTDAIDNSGGVDLSDHEVNLKIFFNHLRERKIISSEEEQNHWLEKVKEEVCQQVLANNYSQSLCLSLDRERCLRDTEPFMELADRLENSGLLDRLSDTFPYRKEVLARHGEGLTRPELAVLVSYSKTQLYQILLEQPDILSEPFLQEFAISYFPRAINEQFGNHIYDHPLGKEITATILCNTIIDHTGCSFLTWVEELKDIPIAHHPMVAYLVFNKILEGNTLRTQIYALDTIIPASRQYSLLLQFEDTLANFCHWNLANNKQIIPNEKTLSSFHYYLEQYELYQEETLTKSEDQPFKERVRKLIEEGFSAKISRRIALLDRLTDFPLLVELASTSGKEFSLVVSIYEAVSNYLGYSEVKEILHQVPVRNRWEHRAITTFRERFEVYLSNLALAILAAPDQGIANFFSTTTRQQRLLQYQRIREELRETPPTDLLPFTVLSRKLETLIQG